MSIQGFSNGAQMRDLFAAYNANKGSAVVDMSRNYNTGSKYRSKISDGNQVDLALKEINAEEGAEIFKALTPDYGDGVQLKSVAATLVLLGSLGNAVPVWFDSMPDEVTIKIGDSWPWPVSDYNLGNDVPTYDYNLTMPTGLTLAVDGSWTGTVSVLSSGTIEFTAENSNGESSSKWVSWNVIAA